jgi:broad specificity phosphatase PhoE
LLIRHAETSAPNIFHGAESDIGLSARGEHQAQRLAAALKGEVAQALYCSGMRRAVATATHIGAACRLTSISVPQLHERSVGPLSGSSLEAGWEVYAESKRHWMSGDLEFTHPGGESFAGIRRRVLPVFEEILKRHQGTTVIVVAHGVVIRVVLLSLLESLQPADFDSIAIDFASINDLRWDGQTWKAHALNQVIAPSQASPMA